jgi:hypothetical protein
MVRVIPLIEQMVEAADVVKVTVFALNAVALKVFAAAVCVTLDGENAANVMVFAFLGTITVAGLVAEAVPAALLVVAVTLR